jgi:hypothetical protein
MVRLERLGQLKYLMTSAGIELATFRLVAQCLNKLRYREIARTSIYIPEGFQLSVFAK